MHPVTCTRDEKWPFGTHGQPLRARIGHTRDLNLDPSQRLSLTPHLHGHVQVYTFEAPIVHILSDRKNPSSGRKSGRSCPALLDPCRVSRVRARAYPPSSHKPAQTDRRFHIHHFINDFFTFRPPRPANVPFGCAHRSAAEWRWCWEEGICRASTLEPLDRCFHVFKPFYTMMFV